MSYASRVVASCMACFNWSKEDYQRVFLFALLMGCGLGVLTGAFLGLLYIAFFT